MRKRCRAPTARNCRSVIGAKRHPVSHPRNFFMAPRARVRRIIELIMCGIVGYVGARDATPLLIEGLRRLEYRGYDSAGIAVLEQSGEARVVRCRGKLSALEKLLADRPPRGSTGIG